MPEPGTIIDGRYRVVSRIGSGGMADVFLAEDMQLGRQVALKILHRRFAEDQEFVERFRREASSAAGLSHPNVVNVFDRGETEGTYYIAMEYLPGESLKSIVRRVGAVDPATAIDYVIQILRAARFAHQRGIIHRDLKPHNVIVDEEGRVRVTDFGIARAGASDMTQTGSIMGTAQYLSPEQAQGHAVSAASDIYAIGIVLYELLTGTLPFDGETAVTIALKQVSELPMPPSAVNPAVPPALDAVVLRALAKDPAERFPDAGAFIAALEQVRAGLQPDIGDTARFAASELAAVAAAAGVAGLGAPPPPPAAALALPPLSEPEPEDEEEQERRRRWWWIAAAIVLLVGAGVAAALLLRPTSVTVPTLARCESQALAVAQLRQRGLTPIEQRVTTLACPAGGVVGQSPSGGSIRDTGSNVIVQISAGPGVATVPSVAGDTRSAAVAALTAAGFHPTVQPTASSSVPAGQAISTIPRAGTSLARGTSVSVLVSSGPQTVSVPDVRGELETAAALALVDAGLKTGTVTEVSSSQPPGTVLSQDPGQRIAHPDEQRGEPHRGSAAPAADAHQRRRCRCRPGRRGAWSGRVQRDQRHPAGDQPGEEQQGGRPVAVGRHEGQARLDGDDHRRRVQCRHHHDDERDDDDHTEHDDHTGDHDHDHAGPGRRGPCARRRLAAGGRGGPMSEASSLTVAVIAGGRSSEHEVSLASGRAVAEGLREAGHRVAWIVAERDGSWRHEGETLCVTPGGGLLGADVAFPALHGPFGEDGTVQGLLELLDVAYVGAGVTASAVCLDKVLFKELMAPTGLPQVPYAWLREARWRAEREVALAGLECLGLPVFVKPARLGSSVGIVKVSERVALATALDTAFEHDPLVIVEGAATGAEVECSVIGSLRSEVAAGAPPAIASQPGEIVFAADWYDYDAKYTPGGMELVVPPRISPAAIERVRELAVQTFVAADCAGLARVDFFVDGGRVIVNELNTMPGFTPTSVYAKLFAASGRPYPEVVDRLCRLALERHEERARFTY